jgi:hypothetical protein
MKIKNSLLFFCVSSFYTTICSQSVTIKAYGLYNKTEQVKIVDNNIGLYLGGFDPQYGYQGGIVYTQPVYKSFVILGEMGYLTKGYNTIDTRTMKKLLAVNYKYLYFKPSVGYQWRGLTISAGLFLNLLLNEEAVKKGWSNSTFKKPEIATSFEFSYQYKNVGLSISTNNNINPMRTITAFSDVFDHYNQWYSVGLSYQIYKKKQREGSK